MKFENFKRFSLKMLCCEARAFPVGIIISRPFYSAENAHAYELILDTWLLAILFLRETFLRVRLGHSRGGSAGIRNLYSYVTTSGDIRYDNGSYAAIVQRKSRVRGRFLLGAG